MIKHVLLTTRVVKYDKSRQKNAFNLTNHVIQYDMAWQNAFLTNHMVIGIENDKQRLNALVTTFIEW